MRLRLFDYLALFLSVSLVALVSVLAYGDTGRPEQVAVQTDEGEFLYPLNQDRTIPVSGPLGETVIEIHDEEVRIVESPCRDQICVAAGTLESTGQWAACLPNRVFVRVEGSSVEGEIDALSY
jgi:hypothetical protein